MTVPPEWISIVIGALVAGGTCGAWIQKQVDRARSATPIIRDEWREMDDGFSVSIEIVNRINEDLAVTKAEARGAFMEYIHTYDDGGSIIPAPRGENVKLIPSPYLMDFTVSPGEAKRLKLQVSGADSPRWVRITLCSSLKTIRSKRFTLCMRRKL